MRYEARTAVNPEDGMSICGIYDNHSGKWHAWEVAETFNWLPIFEAWAKVLNEEC